MLRAAARGRGRGRGNRSGRGPGSQKDSSKPKTKEMKFNPQATGKGTYGTFASVLEHVISFAQRSYGPDVAQSIRDMKVVDLDTDKPELKLVTKVDPTDEDKVIPDPDCQKAEDMFFSARVKLFLNREEKLKEGLKKLYSTILANCCTDLMVTRLQQDPSYDTPQDDPIALLKKIKELVHDTVRAKLPWLTLQATERRMLNIQQMEEESLTDYVKRAK